MAEKKRVALKRITSRGRRLIRPCLMQPMAVTSPTGRMQSEYGKGGVNVTNSEELNKLIKKSGLKRGYIADVVGISYYSLNKKINNESPFKAGEIQIMCELLGITDLEEKERIFFAEDVEKYSTK